MGSTNSDKLMEKIATKYTNTKLLIVQNKIDMIAHNSDNNSSKLLYISAKNNIGMEELKDYVYKLAKESVERTSDILINQRHSLLLKTAAEFMKLALKSLEDNYENEFIAMDVRKSVKILGELTGETWNEEVLEHIFSNFCIGK